MEDNSPVQDSFFIRYRKQDDLDLSAPPADKYAGLRSDVWLIWLDIDVSLYTNCTNKEIIVDVIDYLYAISIPIDSISHIDIMRNEKHFVNVLDVLNFLENKNNLQTIVKIGTVVTKANIHETSRICEFISTYKKINVWKLYQYSPEEILSGKRVKEHSAYYEKFFFIRETSVRGIRVEYNEESIAYDLQDVLNEVKSVRSVSI